MNPASPVEGNMGGSRNPRGTSPPNSMSAKEPFHGRQNRTIMVTAWTALGGSGWKRILGCEVLPCRQVRDQANGFKATPTSQKTKEKRTSKANLEIPPDGWVRNQSPKMPPARAVCRWGTAAREMRRV
ncbi:hypothetical protein BJX63DRAFT_413014 [Aspergillus granulosus]|uniref:Uncharacterized protein n=1 Tax=Aspergillus granulosus TaxID=176169 RepID=A0ABR4GVM2_9EURO